MEGLMKSIIDVVQIIQRLCRNDGKEISGNDFQLSEEALRQHRTEGEVVHHM